MADFDCNGGRRRGEIRTKLPLNGCKPSEADFSTKSAHIITLVGRVRTSAQAELVDGMCLDAKDRMNGAVRCAV
ncbi:MAG: hypothetical protein OXC62_14325 [Aestuariivita sp.]|nr:hypothetical protein [Aestuariivita sp.]